jgi:hypothetical protein
MSSSGKLSSWPAGLFGPLETASFFIMDREALNYGREISELSLGWYAPKPKQVEAL